MKLLAHAEDHLTEDFPSGSTQFNLLQFQKVQRCSKKFLQMIGEKPLMGQGDRMDNIIYSLSVGQQF